MQTSVKVSSIEVKQHTSPLNASSGNTSSVQCGGIPVGHQNAFQEIFKPSACNIS